MRSGVGFVNIFMREMNVAPLAQLSGEEFLRAQQELARFNALRLHPGLGEEPNQAWFTYEARMLDLERRFVTAARQAVRPWLEKVPNTAEAFMAWFEELACSGPGQGDPLFPWLAEEASYEQMRWFLAQEIGGEAGFDDLVAMTQVKMPVTAKLEMARNYWDEMGRGTGKGMHGPMLSELARYLGLHSTPENTVAEALALGNMMIALAVNRRFAFHSAGALGVIEMTAPGRAALVVRGLDRLGVPKKQSHYFSLHAVLDKQHSAAWNEQILRPLVEEHPQRAHALAEGAVLRLWCGARCFERYRRVFNFPQTSGRASRGLPVLQVP